MTKFAGAEHPPVNPETPGVKGLWSPAHPVILSVEKAGRLIRGDADKAVFPGRMELCGRTSDSPGDDE